MGRGWTSGRPRIIVHARDFASVIVHSTAEDDGAFLSALGDRVRELRARRGMTRKILAKDSGVSERYLAQLETGQGNASLAILRRIARALDVPLHALIADAPDDPAGLTQAVELLRRLGPEQLGEAHALLLKSFGAVDAEARARRIALIGLRGAGKTTLGAALAERLGVPFIELDREIERESGVSLATIFDFYGQAGFRRMERRCLDRIIEEHPRFVLATGGSIVSEPATYERLLAACYTIWLKAAPAEHMERVVAQGDMRPMAGNRESMADLQRILTGREPLYRRADAEVDTSGKPATEALESLVAAAPANGAV
ncbi:MAG: helix-turn-helix transcriptional regulator [Candidatus Eremiobacteraeota bacterium]|nr:helix-turn-helix transcriptional regulator [Candidatus Eremiobacteraeota bacterium]